jgi:hypothetical protein
MPNTNPMQSLYKRLSSAGGNPAYVKSVALPEWWSDDVAEVQAGHVQGVGLIANHLGIPFEILWDESAEIICRDEAWTKFKRSKDVDPDELRWSKCIGQRAAEFAADAGGFRWGFPGEEKSRRTPSHPSRDGLRARGVSGRMPQPS